MPHIVHDIASPLGHGPGWSDMLARSMANTLGLKWELVSPFGIELDEAAFVWHSGHVTDVLEVDGGGAGHLVATETGGVWSVPRMGASVALSNTWENPDVNCLAAGPHGDRHFYAGTAGVRVGNSLVQGGRIYETNVNSLVPILDWAPVADRLPSAAGDVNRLLVLRSTPRIVAVCSGGVWWADIPPAPAPPAAAHYDWQPAVDNAYAQAGYYDGALGTRTAERPELDNVLNVTVVLGALAGGIAVGRWGDKGLVLRPALIVDGQGTDVTAWYFALTSRTSVAGCATRGSRLYAATANPVGTLRFVLRSDDAGITWTLCGDDVDGSAAGLRVEVGDQGAWNNCVAAHQDKPDVVALGWQKGTFLSADAGASWKRVESPHPHLHDDVHVLRFPPTRDGFTGLLVGSDGGLAEVGVESVLAASGTVLARSDFNRNLATHQCYSTLVSRQFSGTLGVGRDQDDLVVTGVHDNGNIACRVTPQPEPWKQLHGGDGGWTGVVADGGLVHQVTPGGTTAPFEAHRQVFSGFLSLGIVPIGTAPGAPGLVAVAADTVRRPSFHNAAGGRMYAAAAAPSLPGNPQQRGVYGLFVEPTTPLLYHWEWLADFPAGLTPASVAADTGASVLVGCGPRIFALDSGQGTYVETPVNLPKPYPGAVPRGGAVTRIVALPDRTAYALLNGVTYSAPAGSLQPSLVASFVLRLDGLSWSATGWAPTGAITARDGALYALEVVVRPNRPHLVVVAADAVVYASTDDGRTWEGIGDGLPARPHNADLRYLTGPGQELGALYLSTFGRSVWRASTIGLGR